MLGCTPWALLFPLPLDKKRSPCSRAGFILGGSLHAKTHRPDLLASICCMSVGLSLIPSSLQHCLGSLVWLHRRSFPSAWLCLFHDPTENTLPPTHFFMYKGLKFVCILLTNYQLLCYPFKKTSRRKETPSSELWKKHDLWFRAKWSHYS